MQFVYVVILCISIQTISPGIEILLFFGFCKISWTAEKCEKIFFQGVIEAENLEKEKCAKHLLKSH